MKKLRFLFPILFLWSCAQVVIPDGGAKDIEPPVIMASSPQNFSTNYSGTGISLMFDEYIQLKNEQTQVIVSPTLGNLNYRIRGKSLFIDFDTIPKPNTTYIINFGEAIVDFNESNPLDSNIFVFSTGDKLDSLKITGKVEMAGDRKVEKGILVMLYSDLSDSVIYKNMPEYVTRTDGDGSYSLNYLKPGTYQQIALKDENNNFLFDDLEKEMIGFHGRPISLVEDTSINIQIFSELSPTQRLRSATQAREKVVVFAFALPVDSFQVSISEPDLILDTVMYYHPERDSISLYMPALEPTDTFEIIYSVAGMEQDTQRITPVLKLNKKGGLPQNLIISLQQETNKNVPYKDSLILRFNSPVIRVNEEKVILKRRTDTIPAGFMFERNSMELIIKTELAEDSTYFLSALPGAFTDASGRQNDTLVWMFGVNPEEYYGNLAITPIVKDSAGQYLLELKDDKGVTVGMKAFEETTRLEFNRLPPGSYTLRLIFDTNGNGKWDSGSYREKRQPEKVVLYYEGITIRSNWDQDLEWEVEGKKKPTGKR